MAYKSITETPTSVILYELVRRGNTHVIPVTSAQAYRVQVSTSGGMYRTEDIGLGAKKIVVIKS